MQEPVVLLLKPSKNNDKTPQAAANFFGGIAELFRHHGQTISLEITVSQGFLYFFVVCEKHISDLVRGQLFSQYPNLTIDTVSDYMPRIISASIVSLRLERPDAYPTKTYNGLDTDFLTNLAGMASSISKNDTIMVQILIRPVNTESVAYKLQAFTACSWRASMRKNSSLAELLAKSEQEKLHKPLFASYIRVAASSGDKNELIATSAASLFKILDNPQINNYKIQHSTHSIIDFQNRTFPRTTYLLSSEELATIYHMPSMDNAIAQVATTTTKTSEPPANLPISSTVMPFAETTFRGVNTKFGIKREDRRKHLYIIGKTGVGKSKLIELLALADIQQGKGCVVMDPHGDLAEELLRYIPRDRLHDVIYFNPADIEYPMSFNPLEGVGSFEFKQTVVSGFISIFKKLFSFTWNQRLEHVLRFTTLALLDLPNATILGITKMLSDSQYRQYVISHIQDPVVKKFWATEFTSWNDQYAGEAITPIINKVGQFISNPAIRNIVGQQKSVIKLDDIINNEKILIANFSIGKLGEENSALLGAMFITKLWQASVARSNIPEEERKDTYLYVDEFQNFATSAFANILSEARKYRLNLTVAHQYMAQLPEEVKSTIFGNVGSTISFRIGGEDASVLEKEFTPTFVPEDFMRLDMRNFYAKILIDGQTAVPFSGKTLDFPKPDEDFKQDVIKISRERFARPRSEVEKEIQLFEDSKLMTEVPQNSPQFSEPLL
jgi:hypothetical protein